MGQSQSSKNRAVNQWTFIDSLGNFQIFKNQHNQLAEKHVVRTDPKIEQSDYITAYHQRYLPNKPIVSVYDAQFSQKSKSLCQNSSTINVFTEYIPHRLSGVKRLNHGQGIYVLSESLAGFSELFGRVGPFQINQDLIGFNPQGQVKVWYNPNFAENSVDNDRIILMSTVNPYEFDRKFSQNQEHDMVEDTINAVARYTNFHPKFLQQAEFLKKLSFSEARRILADQIARKTYYVPDHLFLGDRNDIVKKSGVQLKHKHVYNPNKPKKGQGYPYFTEDKSYQHGQTHYLQGPPPYPNYNYGYDNDSQTSESSNAYNGQGYYNMNGQNYRVVATREFEGNHINQQAIIDQVLANNNYNQQPQNYSNDPHYAQVRSGVHTNQVYYDNRSQTSSQYIRKNPRYQQGHIVINDGSQKKKSHNQLYTLNNQYQQAPQQQTVRVFSIGEDGRLVEQNNHQNYNNSYYGSGIQNSHHNQSYVQPHYQRQENTRVIVNDPTHSQIYGERYTPNVSSHVRDQVVPGNINIVHPNKTQQNYQNISHRHRIFEPVHTPQQSLIREEAQMAPQRAF